jgi:23S rRNA (uracil1939-C5)-methyltransferase
MLMSSWINTTLKLLQNKTEETSQLTIRYGINSNEWLIQPALYNKDVSIRSGQGYYREQLLDKTFRISSPSFFQVNTKQAEKLAEIVRERADVKNSKLAIDAYAGVGTFAVLLAPLIKKVIAIEESHSALKDAAINTIGINNLEFVNGKTEDVLKTLAENPDVVILDPSRSGCHQQVIDVLLHRRPTRIIYVSCEAKSLAKDLSQLVRGGFQIESVEPIDMFPQTYHVESVTTLTRNT